jgi:lipopolysaccharide export system protein LptA
MKQFNIDIEQNKILAKEDANKINEAHLEKEYNDEYNRHKVDNDRNVQSYAQTFSYMSNHQLNILVTNFSFSQHGRDSRIADALVAELQKRELNELCTTLKNYLFKIEYKKPWLRKE